MDSMIKNKTTASSAEGLENGEFNPMAKERRHSAGYFALLKTRRQLPVSKKRQEFLDIYQGSPVMILLSDTGSGKTTQIPQFVLFDEFNGGGKIACTQPRRLGATSVARRVAEELDVKLGEEVGYAVRFDNRTTDKTRLTYMTEGVLLGRLSETDLYHAIAA